MKEPFEFYKLKHGLDSPDEQIKKRFDQLSTEERQKYEGEAKKVPNFTVYIYLPPSIGERSCSPAT